MVCIKVQCQRYNPVARLHNVHVLAETGLIGALLQAVPLLIKINEEVFALNEATLSQVLVLAMKSLEMCSPPKRTTHSLPVSNSWWHCSLFTFGNVLTVCWNCSKTLQRCLIWGPLHPCQHTVYKTPSETVPTNQTQVGLINMLLIISTLARIRFLLWLDKSTGATVWLIHWTCKYL